jgi:hypothetical protein
MNPSAEAPALCFPWTAITALPITRSILLIVDDLDDRPGRPVGA